MQSTGSFGWTATSQATDSADTLLKRFSAGNIVVSNASTNSIIIGAIGAVLNATGSVLTNSATSGFTHLPSTAGTPTGIPANIFTGATATVVDTTNTKIWGYISGSWQTLGIGGIPSTYPTWSKYTVAYTSFSAGSTTNNVTLFSLPAGGVIHGVKLKHSTAFAGGAISAYTVSVGLSSFPAKYAPAFDVFQATGSTIYEITSELGGEDQVSTTPITATATSTGTNLNAATQGSVDIWVLTSVAV